MFFKCRTFSRRTRARNAANAHQDGQQELVVDGGEVELAERNEDERRKREISDERVHAFRLHLGNDVEPIVKES